MDLQGSNSEDLRRLRLLRQSQGPIRVTVAPERTISTPNGTVIRRSQNLRTGPMVGSNPKTAIDVSKLMGGPDPKLQNRSLFERFGDKFEANSPQDIYTRVKRGDTAEYKGPKFWQQARDLTVASAREIPRTAETAYRSIINANYAGAADALDKVISEKDPNKRQQLLSKIDDPNGGVIQFGRNKKLAADPNNIEQLAKLRDEYRNRYNATPQGYTKGAKRFLYGSEPVQSSQQRYAGLKKELQTNTSAAQQILNNRGQGNVSLKAKQYAGPLAATLAALAVLTDTILDPTDLVTKPAKKLFGGALDDVTEQAITTYGANTVKTLASEIDPVKIKKILIDSGVSEATPYLDDMSKVISTTNSPKDVQSIISGFKKSYEDLDKVTVYRGGDTKEPARFVSENKDFAQRFADDTQGTVQSFNLNKTDILDPRIPEIKTQIERLLGKSEADRLLGKTPSGVFSAEDEMIAREVSQKLGKKGVAVDELNIGDNPKDFGPVKNGSVTYAINDPQALEQAVEALPPNTAISQQTPVTAAPEGVPSTSADIAQADVGNLADEAAQQAEGMKNLYGKETLVQKIAKLWDPLSPLRKMDKARAKALGIRAVDLPKTQSTEALAQVSKNSKEMAAQALKDTNTARVIQKYQTKGPDSTDFNFYRVAMRDLEQRADGRPAIFRELDDNSLNNWIAEYEARNPEARQDLLDIVADVRAFQDYGAELVSPEDLARVRLKKDGTEFQFWTPIQRATPDDVATPVISGQNIGTVGRQKILQEQLGSDLPPDVSFDALTDYVETVYKQVNQAKVARTVTENVQAGLVPGARVIQTGDETARISQLRQNLSELRDVSKSLQTELKAVRSKVRLAKKDVAIAGKQLGIADEKQAGKVRMAKSDYTRKVNEATSQAKRLLKQMLSDDVDSASAIDSLTPDELVDLLGVSTQDELFSKGAKGKAQFRAVSNSKDKLFGTPPKQDSIEPLIEEARKYKSASEYADSIQNPKPTKDGYVVAYHGTGADNIDSIKQNGFNLSKRNKGSESPDSHFFVVGDNPKGQYGGSTVAVQIPKEIADAYGGTTKGNVLYIPDSLAKKIEVLTTDKLLIDNKRKSDFFKDLDNKRYTVENVEEALNRNIYDKTTTQNVREAIAEYKQLTDLYNQATQSPKSIPEEGIIQQTSKQQEAAYARIAKKSEAHRQMVERLQDLKMDIESADNARKGIGRELVELRPDSITGRQTILGIDENGNKFRVELPPEYAAVLQGTDKEQMNGILRGFRLAQQPFREAYTGVLNPAFQIAQATFNAIWAPILKGPKVFGPRAMKAAFSALNQHSLNQQMLREAGITIYGGNLQKLVKDTSADAIAAQADTLTKLKWNADPRRAWQQLSLAGGKIDQMARAAVAQVEYDNAIKKSLTHEEALANAVYTYNNAFPNFGNAASLIQQADAIIPYFSAGQTGTRAALRAVKENPVGVGGRIAAFGLAVSGLTAYNLAKDEGEAFYADMENSGKKYVLDNNLILVLPGARKDPKTGEWTGIIKLGVTPELRPVVSAINASFSPTQSGVPVRQLATAVFDTVTGGTRNNRSPLSETGYGVVTGKDPRTGRDIYDETMTDEERRAAAGKYVVGSFGVPGKVIAEQNIGEVFQSFKDRVYGAKGISEGGQYYKNEGEAIKQVGLNKNELDAYRSTIAPRSKDLAGNDIKDKTYYDSASKAVTWLRYPKTFEVSKAMDAKNRAAGKPGDPLFDLPPDQLKIVLNLMANYSPGNFEEKAIQQLNPWIKDFNKKRSEYFDKVIPADKKGSTDAMGITIPKATPQLQTKLDQVSKITDKKQKAQYYADNPDITDYYKKTEDYQRTKRAFLGLPQFDRYPTASKEVQGYMDTYNALPKGNGPLKKDGTPSSPDRSAWIKSHPNEWAALTEQWAKQDIFNTQKEGAEAVYEGIDMEQDTVDKLAGALGTTKQGFYDQYGNIDKETALNLLKLLSPDKDYTFKSPDTKIKVQKVRYKIPKSVGKKSKVKLG